MDTDKEFDAFTDEVPFDPIYRLPGMQARARLVLANRSEHEIRVAASTIEWLTNEYFEKEKESWITHQVKTNGSILRHLPEEDRTEYGLGTLVDQNPDIISDEFDFPNEENTTRLEALEDSLKGVDLDDENFPDAKPYEYFAVLALVLIGEAILSYQEDEWWPPVLKADLPMVCLRSIANDAVDIMEVICRAEQRQDEYEMRKRIEAFLHDNEKRIPEQVEDLVRKKVSLAASLAANARHKETSESRSAALLCWDNTGSNFSSRTAFARNKHREYGVTERTLYGWVTAHVRSKT
ncbi:hypothetical protein SAMN03159443_02929 [Pseudomonas sp. NFACC15-1]|uniref:hypothetical protein n=1 Tax=unclassified Pseudomonas TaxID=196821 RepID=UPI000887327F|nr:MULTISPECIES: hypothetical protein [unclassified Pseudomonas]SDA76984.1 hypothetical protein SAMN03159443_02929 [Pseudomonas sp. NFACC15-1]SDY33685.1 hypothetical protein SAMN03159380_03883 [Pseudomonas sp. NFACC14]